MMKKFETYYIKDNEYIELLKNDIFEGVHRQDNLNYKSNVKAKMTSSYYFVSEKSKNLNKLKSLINNYNIAECWGNIYSKGDYTLPHKHDSYPDWTSGKYDISGVLYLSDSKTGTYFNDLDILITAEKGKVVIFNPNFVHSVPTVEEDERITLSFNGYKQYKMTYQTN